MDRRTRFPMFFLSLLAALAAPTTVPATRVTLDPPEGFVLSEQFTGFTDGGTGSILVTELRNVPVGEMVGQLTPEAIASKGMKEVERIRDGAAVLLRVEQSVSGLTVEKWMRIDGDDQSTIMVVGTVARGDARLDALKTSLLGVELADAPSTETPEAMRYAITPAGDLQPAGTFSTMQMFTVGGAAPPVPDDQPRFMCGPSVSSVDLTDVEAFARQRLAQLPFDALRSVEATPVTIAGREGVELQAMGTLPETRVDRTVYQLILPAPGNTYFIAVGIGADKKEWKLFQEMAHSLRFDVE